jgi:hypothetical protein
VWKDRKRIGEERRGESELAARRKSYFLAGLPSFKGREIR